MAEVIQTAQERFDTKYITSTEIASELQVSRTALVNARHRGLLPAPIAVNGSNIYIWEREEVRPYVDAWKLILNVRRAVKNG